MKVKLFSSVLNTIKKEKRTKKPAQKIPIDGQNIYTFVEISFEESVLGCTKQIPVNRREKCTCTKKERSNCILCNGKGEIVKTTVMDFKIPKGVFDTQTIVIKGKGYRGSNGGKHGDLLIKIHVKPSDIYERRGIDIFSHLTISYPEAVLGTNKIINTVYGKVDCNIPKGICSGAKLCLTAKGLLMESTGEIGNHYVVIDIDVPKQVNEKEEALLRELSCASSHSENSN